jgi:hypothetical protein
MLLEQATDLSFSASLLLEVGDVKDNRWRIDRNGFTQVKPIVTWIVDDALGVFTWFFLDVVSGSLFYSHDSAEQLQSAEMLFRSNCKFIVGELHIGKCRLANNLFNVAKVAEEIVDFSES